MELENFLLTSCQGKQLHDVLQLMQVETNYMNQIYQLIYILFVDPHVANNAEFHEFVLHYHASTQHHITGAGFGEAMDVVQVYHYVLLEKLMDNKVLAAAEELEEAILHLELAMEDVKIKANPQIILLNQSIELLEEVQLKIIQYLQQLLEKSRRCHWKN
ncbi:hypothetical protein P22_0054 [Propionispora sp. 2/2-37]|uniref:hypothetical protein n=1 Tax=Propionispora sp. 2/2-37 TaxID=1677858 RepID=UPI0006BB87FF|nr:hypothetical protein [Propionispora sp. 2/2-37]CUH93992.1 hypothetical protein P22_0054 [Propionispora sp. 2/2-37]